MAFILIGWKRYALIVLSCANLALALGCTLLWPLACVHDKSVCSAANLPPTIILSFEPPPHLTEVSKKLYFRVVIPVTWFKYILCVWALLLFRKCKYVETLIVTNSALYFPAIVMYTNLCM